MNVLLAIRGASDPKLVIILPQNVALIMIFQNEKLFWSELADGMKVSLAFYSTQTSSRQPHGP